MSLLPQQQQPLTVYPETVGGQLLPAPSSYGVSSTSGSYMTVLIILSSIVVVCSIACCLGRFCSRRCDKPEPFAPKTKAAAIHPKEKETVIEFGFDHKKIKTASRPVRFGDLGGLNGRNLNHGNKHINHGDPTFTCSYV